MITEDYVSFEIAKFLKEKGFDEPFYFFYRTDDRIIHHVVRAKPLVYDNKAIDDEVISAPTHQMVMKWLREKHNLQIIIIPIRVKLHKNWTFEIIKEFNPLTIDAFCFSTYEEACEAAIKYCLKNLI